ncbi:hypothetical protein H5410_041160 [Solanum commersonii]|uniref:Uncharacterized protein n=1 Tax=Solanum commersonii TaxID=4109 RepID=A0A9J5XUN4_SOLCO|nr:hypothetical protein H5410_041160 [Solanum commersonii]
MSMRGLQLNQRIHLTTTMISLEMKVWVIIQKRAWVIIQRRVQRRAWREQELGSQSNHSFSDETNLCINQTFSSKNELDSLYLYYNAAKTYSLKEFNNHFVKFKNKSLLWRFPLSILQCGKDLIEFVFVIKILDMSSYCFF